MRGVDPSPTGRRAGHAEGIRAKFGIDPEGLVEETRANVSDSRPAAEHLVDWFLERVAGE